MLPFNAGNLWDNPGSKRVKKRVGRGPGSGKGKTAGRGHKGTYARSGGKINRGFEGGQSPMHKRFPKYGFRKHRFSASASREFDYLNIGKLAYHIEKGDLDTSKVITMKDLKYAGALSNIKYGVKLLSKGANKFKDLNTPINLEISDASKSAVNVIKETGGSLQVKYRTPLLMRYHLKPWAFR